MTTVLACVVSLEQRGYSRQDYTLQSAVAKILEWSAQAKDFSEYRWRTSRDQLLDSLVGSTIQISALPIAANRISVTADRRATWSTRANLADGISPDGVLDIAIPANQRSGLVGTTNFSGGRVSALNLSIADVSDRLAMEVTGREQISVVGRIRELVVDTSSEQIKLVVDVTSWNRGGKAVEPAHLGRGRETVQQHLRAGQFSAALQAINEILRILPGDAEALQWRESLTVVATFRGLPHDHGAEGVVGSFFGQKSGCTGTLIVRKGFVEFDSTEHPATWEIGAISVAAQLPLKGFSISWGPKQRYRFMVEMSLAEAVIAAVDRAQRGR